MNFMKEDHLLEVLSRIAQSLSYIEKKMEHSMLQYEKATKDAESNNEIVRLQRILIEKQIIDTYGLETLKLWKQGKTSWEYLSFTK